MTFVDTNVVMYAVGRPHPLKEEARTFFESALRDRVPLATSAEVLQELLHAYLPVARLETLDAALELVGSLVGTVWPVEPEDVLLARSLASRHGELGARHALLATVAVVPGDDEDDRQADEQREDGDLAQLRRPAEGIAHVLQALQETPGARGIGQSPLRHLAAAQPGPGPLALALALRRCVGHRSPLREQV